MGGRTLIELNNVYLRSDRGGQVFQDLCLLLKAGRSAIITGSTGSGKTTLVELLIGQRWAQSGSVEVMGQVLKSGRSGSVKRIRRSIGGVGGVFGLIPALAVAENITVPLILAGERRKVRRERLLKVLGEFSLLKLASAYPQTLTRVENILVQFARASIAHQPLMLIDEPLAGLEKTTYRRVLDYLAAASLSGRSLVILASDNLVEQLPNADHYQLADGKLT